MVTVVSHYGIHRDANGTAFLMQGRGGSNAIGLKEKPPFEVRLPKGKHCNHQIPLAVPVPHDVHWIYFQQLLDDALVQAMLPIPKVDGGCYFIAEGNEPYLVLLSKLSSPIYPCVVPVWTLTPEAIIQELQQTNVQPFVVTQLEAKHSNLIAQVAKSAAYLPRKLVLSGQKDVVLPPTVKRIDTTLDKFDMNDLVALPWEGLGATVVRKFMRNESFKMTPEQMKEQGRPLASSARDRFKIVAALLVLMVLPALAACAPPNQAACQGRFTIGDSEYAMKSHFPHPEQQPLRTVVVAGMEQKTYSNPCAVGHAYLFVENGRLVGWSQ